MSPLGTAVAGSVSLEVSHGKLCERVPQDHARETDSGQKASPLQRPTAKSVTLGHPHGTASPGCRETPRGRRAQARGCPPWARSWQTASPLGGLAAILTCARRETPRGRRNHPGKRRPCSIPRQKASPLQHPVARRCKLHFARSLDCPPVLVVRECPQRTQAGRLVRLKSPFCQLEQQLLPAFERLAVHLALHPERLH